MPFGAPIPYTPSEAKANGPQLLSDVIGALDDSVKLELGGEDLVIAESWDIVESVFSQPSAFSIRVGHGDVAAGLLKKYPLGKDQKRTPFKLYVGNVAQMSGLLDARGASQPPGGATEITFRGRDRLAVLHDSHVEAVTSFTNWTYGQLVQKALAEVGLDSGALIGSNDANRLLKAGKPVNAAAVRAATQSVEEILSGKGLNGSLSNGAIVERQQEAKVNETWHQFVRRHIDRAGLFLWATADEKFVLTQPDAGTEAIYSLQRGTGAPIDQLANVVSMSFEDDATRRHTAVVIYGRGGGKKKGRAKSKGAESDDEMVEYGYKQPIVYRDIECKTQAEASFFSLRKLAEERRDGYRLEYTIAGHTLPASSGNGDRYVVSIDTVVQVDDQELGIRGHFYVSEVRRQRGPQTTTTIRLTRLQDLIFGGVEEGL
jgi:prophage tail gpP-like protein